MALAECLPERVSAVVDTRVTSFHPDSHWAVGALRKLITQREDPRGRDAKCPLHTADRC